MIYISTRDKTREVAASEAITRGISPEGGLFVPKTLPRLDAGRLAELTGMDYIGRAADPLQAPKNPAYRITDGLWLRLSAGRLSNDEDYREGLSGLKSNVIYSGQKLKIPN